MTLRNRHRAGAHGQAMVELALIFPLFILVFFGIIVLGIGVFYQQQLTNAAREAARYASIHSGSASKPTVSWLEPQGSMKPLSYDRYDRPEDSWPFMTAAGRSLIFGLDENAVNIAACWSGWTLDGNWDARPALPAPGYSDIPGAYNSTFEQCHIDGADPTQDPGAISCTTTLAQTTTPALGGDRASDISEGQGRIVANTVTAYACYEWKPPLAGFLLIPQTVTLRAVITEPIERQQ
jgi:TadE-like protein